MGRGASHWPAFPCFGTAQAEGERTNGAVCETSAAVCTATLILPLGSDGPTIMTEEDLLTAPTADEAFTEWAVTVGGGTTEDAVER